MNSIILYVGAILILFWGVAHLLALKPVVGNFGDLARDNRLILVMEWVVEGLTFCFIGVIVILVTALAGSEQLSTPIVYLSSAVFLLILSILSLFTGARAKDIPFKICPVIKTTTAILFIAGSL
ncbi:MAG: hypothetical protein P8012_03800 [Desulfobacterales bacterium]